MHRRWQHVSAVAALTVVLTGTWVAPTAAKDPSKGTAGPTLQAAAIAGLAIGPTSTSSPITYAFGADGLYEFYSLGIDRAGNREVAPAAADAATTKTSGATWSPSVKVNNDTGTTQQNRGRRPGARWRGVSDLG